MSKLSFPKSLPESGSRPAGYVLIEDEGRFYEARGVGDTETRAVNDAARVWQRDFPHARAVRVTVTIGPRLYTVPRATP